MLAYTGEASARTSGQCRCGEGEAGDHNAARCCAEAALVCAAHHQGQPYFLCYIAPPGDLDERRASSVRLTTSKTLWPGPLPCPLSPPDQAENVKVPAKALSAVSISIEQCGQRLFTWPHLYRRNMAPSGRRPPSPSMSLKPAVSLSRHWFHVCCAADHRVSSPRAGSSNVGH
jgi:hypothetical protein